MTNPTARPVRGITLSASCEVRPGDPLNLLRAAQELEADLLTAADRIGPNHTDPKTTSVVGGTTTAQMIGRRGVIQKTETIFISSVIHCKVERGQK